MARVKRESHATDTDAREVKRAKICEGKLSDPPNTNQRVVLNPADCDLDFNIEDNGLEGSALHEHGFAYCWSGARANVGITGGKYYFSCKIIAAQPVETKDIPLEQRHLCRLGISRGDDPVGNLGETDHSFGYGGTGKFSNAGKFSNFGERYGVGDTIVCSVNLVNKPKSFIEFFKDGKWLGMTKQFDAGPNGLGVVDSPLEKQQRKSALFPHVLLKNVIVEMQFSNEDGNENAATKAGYKPWTSALEDGNAVIGPAFTDPRHCEVCMMVGLPGSGKTTWAEKWVKKHPEKRYILLGTNLVLDQMKVPGLMRKQNYGERFKRLMGSATGIFNTLLSRASKTPRNYIIDQTNVYKSARKRKLKLFADYFKIAVVVFPSPEVLKYRVAKRFEEMGKDVPVEEVKNMTDNFVLPMSKDMPNADEYFDQVMFIEHNSEQSQRYLDEMKSTLEVAPNVSSHSHEKPVQSYDPTYCSESSTLSYICPPMQRETTLAGSDRYYESSYQIQPLTGSTYINRDQEDTTYLGASRRGRMDPTTRSYWDMTKLRYACTGTDDFNCDDGSYSMRSGGGMGNNNPYPICGGGRALNHPYFAESTAGIPYQGGGGGFGSPVYHNGGYTNVSGALPADLQIPTQLPFPCPQSTFGGGSPYETPRPRYKSFPTDPRHVGGFGPPSHM